MRVVRRLGSIDAHFGILVIDLTARHAGRKLRREGQREDCWGWKCRGAECSDSENRSTGGATEIGIYGQPADAIQDTCLPGVMVTPPFVFPFAA
jgi:hypothetical protein